MRCIIEFDAGNRREVVCAAKQEVYMLAVHFVLGATPFASARSFAWTEHIGESDLNEHV